MALPRKIAGKSDCFMKIAAVIAEYNPFHNGHRYQIEQTRLLTGADYVLSLMSGNFVQRGAPAIFNKYLRTRMALLGGADAVIELPCLYALSSAEFFAGGAVALLNRLGSIDFLSFGSEEGTLDSILALAGRLAYPSRGYDSLLRSLLKQGLSFPAARYQALAQADSGHKGRIPETLLTSPNNILALEYCKSLLATNSPIRPFTLKRQGSPYHGKDLDGKPGGFSSACAIRAAIEGARPGILEEYPASFLTCGDFSSLLHYRLLMGQEDGFSDYLDCSVDLSDRIRNSLPEFEGFDSFCRLLKTKEVTYTRISRILMHILLEIRTPKAYAAPFLERRLPVPYARLLGFRRTCAPLLSAIKKNADIPLLSKLADAPALLGRCSAQSPERDGLHMLRQDVLASDIYEAVYSGKYGGGAAKNEYRQSPVIL